LIFKAAIFDLGSTLINYENHDWDELGRMGCRNACPILDGSSQKAISPERLWEDFHYAIDQMFINHAEDLREIDLYEVTRGILSNLGVSVLDGLVTRFVDAYYQPITSQISLIPGAHEILSKLRDAGLRIGLISNTIFPAEFHRREMKQFDIFGFFDFTIFSSEIRIRKPSKLIFQKALELAATRPEETIFIGDRLIEDIEGPQALGIKGVLRKVKDRDYSAPITPFRTIEMLSELESIVLAGGEIG
jgi:putative hydrolase of the HAD superfamily